MDLTASQVVQGKYIVVAASATDVDVIISFFIYRLPFPQESVGG